LSTLIIINTKNEVKGKAPEYAGLFWEDLKKSAAELFSVDKSMDNEESILKKKVHVSDVAANFFLTASCLGKWFEC
jgi:hypothetical protein